MTALSRITTATRKQVSMLLLASIAQVLIPTAARAQASKGSWLTGPQADNFWNLMAQSPYAQEGDHGMVVYMMSYSSCGNCITFLRDFWETHKASMQLREIFVPGDQPRLLDEAADVALTRDPREAEAFYKRIKTAPPAASTPARQVALHRVEIFTTEANTFFGQIGHIQNGYPTFVFRVKDERGQQKLMIVSGWSDDFARALNKWVQASDQ